MKPFSAIAAVVFAVVALMQLLRFVMGWEILVNGISIPLWASAIAFVLASVLAVTVWKDARK